MKKNYIIQWKSKVNGRAGRGTKLFERHEAEQLAKELNIEYPEIDHGILEAPTNLGERHTQPAELAGQEQSHNPADQAAGEPVPILSLQE